MRKGSENEAQHGEQWISKKRGAREAQPCSVRPGKGSLTRFIVSQVCLCGSSMPWSAGILPREYNYQDVTNDGMHSDDKIASAKITFGKVPGFSLLKKNNDVLVIVKQEDSEKMLMTQVQCRHIHLRTPSDEFSWSLINSILSVLGTILQFRRKNTLFFKYKVYC